MRELILALLRHVYTPRRMVAALLFTIVLVVLWYFNAIYAWTFAAAVGFVLSSTLVNESRLDINALREEGDNNGRTLSALSRALREGIRATVHLGYIVAGLVALDVLPLPRQIIVPLLMYSAIAMIVNSAIDLVTRPYLYLTRNGEDDLPPPPHHDVAWKPEKPHHEV